MFRKSTSRASWYWLPYFGSTSCHTFCASSSTACAVSRSFVSSADSATVPLAVVCVVCGAPPPPPPPKMSPPKIRARMRPRRPPPIPSPPPIPIPRRSSTFELRPGAKRITSTPPRVTAGVRHTRTPHPRQISRVEWRRKAGTGPLQVHPHSHDHAPPGVEGELLVAIEEAAVAGVGGVAHPEVEAQGAAADRALDAGAQVQEGVGRRVEAVGAAGAGGRLGRDGLVRGGHMLTFGAQVGAADPARGSGAELTLQPGARGRHERELHVRVAVAAAHSVVAGAEPEPRADRLGLHQRLAAYQLGGRLAVAVDAEHQRRLRRRRPELVGRRDVDEVVHHVAEAGQLAAQTAEELPA